MEEGAIDRNYTAADQTKLATSSTKCGFAALRAAQFSFGSLAIVR